MTGAQYRHCFYIEGKFVDIWHLDDQISDWASQANLTFMKVAAPHNVNVSDNF